MKGRLLQKVKPSRRELGVLTRKAVHSKAETPPPGRALPFPDRPWARCRAGTGGRAPARPRQLPRTQAPRRGQMCFQWCWAQPQESTHGPRRLTPRLQSEGSAQAGRSPPQPPRKAQLLGAPARGQYKVSRIKSLWQVPVRSLLVQTGLRWIFVCFRKYPELQLATEFLNII